MDRKSTKISGEVVGGNKLGRQFGFPTANMAVDESFTPGDGVYAALVTVDGTTYRAMANLGVKPTLTGGGRRMLEVNLFGFDEDLYGRTIQVELLDFVRPERRFASFDDLRDALEHDKETVENIFRNTERTVDDL